MLFLLVEKEKAAFQTAIEVMIFFDTQKWYC
jgi:hypothetical protein